MNERDRIATQAVEEFWGRRPESTSDYEIARRACDATAKRCAEIAMEQSIVRNMENALLAIKSETTAGAWDRGIAQATAAILRAFEVEP